MAANLSEHNKGSLAQSEASAFTLSAYDYLDKIPLIGWAWEFWRRSPLSELEQNRTFVAGEGDFPDLPFEPEVFPDLTVRQPDKAMTWEEVENQRCDPRSRLWTPFAVLLSEDGEQNEFGLDDVPGLRINLSVNLVGSTRIILAQASTRIERVVEIAKKQLELEIKKAVIKKPKITWQTGLVLWDLHECFKDYKIAGEKYLRAAYGPSATEKEPQAFALEKCRIVRPFIDQHEWRRFACFK